MIRIYILIIYFLIINLTTFVLRGIDKWKSIKKKRRIRERTLLYFVAFGGWLGALIAMKQFHHKTIKSKFLIWFWLWVGLWIIGIIFLLFWLEF